MKNVLGKSCREKKKIQYIYFFSKVEPLMK